MNRPLYENKNDLKNESSAQQLIEKICKYKLHKLPISYHADFAAFRDNKLKAFVEYKKRNCNSTTYPSIMLSYLKLAAIHNLCAPITGVKGYFFVELNDGLFWCELSKDIPNSYVEWGGRTANTRDSADIEPVIHIPMKNFKELK